MKKLGESKCAFKLGKKRIYKDGKFLSEDINDFFKIKDSFLKNLENAGNENKILSMNDIQMLKTRDYVNYIRAKLENYYTYN